MKSIAVLEEMTLVRVTSPPALPVHRTMRILGEVLDRFEITPHLLAASGRRISFSAHRDDDLESALGELPPSLDVTRIEDSAIITLVGSDAGAAPGISARATRSLGSTRILLLPCGVSDTSISLVVAREDVKGGLEALHGEFFPPETGSSEGDPGNLPFLKGD